MTNRKSDKWRSSAQEIEQLLQRLSNPKQKLDLPAVSPEAAKEIALHIKKVLKQDLH